MNESAQLVVLSLGSNVGDSLSTLKKAIRDLSFLLDGMRVSSLYLTTPQDVSRQPDFCNLVVTGLTSLSPVDLLRQTQAIEARYGRRREGETPRGPRSLDIDIALYGERTVREPDLVIPHERMALRQFVLIPLLELLPDCADPVSGRPYRDILSGLEDQGVRKVGNLYGY